MNPALTMTAARFPVEIRDPEPMSVTLLQLVEAVCAVTDDDAEVIATVLDMLRSGRVRLCGNFRGASGDEFA